MKVFKLNENPENPAIFFDMDSTLYSHPEYAQSQIDLPIKHLATLRGKTFQQMKSEIKEYQKNWADGHEGKVISLGNTLAAFGIPIAESIKWKEELYHPEDYLAPDNSLKVTLQCLSSRFSLAVVTNNPVSVAKRTFAVLGVQDILTKIVGLDTCGVSKPEKVIFLTAAKLCGAEVPSCISVGDRYDIDIALPLEMGMGGILVDGVEDVYKLPELLARTYQDRPDSPDL
jgi:phosphoglycolate phosphatase/putative hydrolase of the HAD superfamily